MPDSPYEREDTFSFGLSDLRGIFLTQRTILLGVFAAVMVAVTLFTVLQTPLYRSTATLHLTMPTTQESGEQSLTTSRAWSMWGGLVGFYETQLQIMTSTDLLQRVLVQYEERLEGPDPFIGSPDTLRDQTTVELRGETELVDIKVLHPDPERAALLANLLAKTYQTHSLEAGREAAREGREWLESQIAEYEERITQLRANLVDYQEVNDLADADQVTTTLGVRVEAVKERLAETRAEAIGLRSRLDYHQLLLDKGAFDELAKQIDTPLLESLTEHYARAVTDLVRVSARYGPRHPDRISAESVLDRIHEELEREVGKAIQGDRTRLEVLESQIGSLESEIASLNQAMLDKQRLRDGFDLLTAEIERSEAYKVRLAQRKDVLDLLARTQLNNARLIETAKPRDIVAHPRPLRNLAAGLVLSMLLAFGAALLRAQTDETIQTPLDVSTYLKSSYLGTIPTLPPHIKDATEASFYTYHNPHSLVSESVRAIRNVVDNATSEPIRHLLVTSALQSEGKTDTSVRLAIAFARSGRKVLLIDADLRRPRQHRAFGIAERRPGLGEVLRGMDPADTIRSTPLDGVDLITAGEGGSDATELLGSAKITEILDILDTRYDLILFDTSPVLLTADPGLLSRFVDGVIVVTRARQTPRGAVRHGINALNKVAAPLLGVVINGASNATAVAGGYYGGKYGYYRYDGYKSDDDSDTSAAK